MYTGHVAIALAARATRRDVPLWVLVAATQGSDWLELVLKGLRAGASAEIWSHAFPFVLLAAGTMAVLVGLWKQSVGAALLVLLVYLSHPVADLVTGYKPLWLGGPPLGLRFIDRPVADFISQGVVCVLGWMVYARSLGTDGPRRIRVVLPLVVLLALQGVSDLFVLMRKPFLPQQSQTVVLRSASDGSTCMGNQYESAACTPYAASFNER